MRSKLLGLLIGIALAAYSAHGYCCPVVSCETCSVTGYTPTTMGRPASATGACSSSDITALVNACLAPTATQATCQAWQTSGNAACVACAITANTAATWGPLVCATTACSLNIPGCADLTLGEVSSEKSSGGGGSCGDALNASYGCQNYACSACTAPSDVSACDNDAVQSECVSYANGVTSACSALNTDAASPADVCFGSGGTINYNAFIALFCGAGGTPLPDGGTTNDAGTKPDAGGTSDSGTTGKDSGSGADGGSGFGSKGGCHCDAAGGGGRGDGLALLVAGAFALSGLRRRSQRRST